MQIIGVVFFNALLYAGKEIINHRCAKLEKSASSELEIARKQLKRIETASRFVKTAQEYLVLCACISLAAPYMVSAELALSYYEITRNVAFINLLVDYVEMNFSINENLSDLIKDMQKVFFCVQYLQTMDTLVHEFGHASVASALFENANPVIQITGSGGLTSWTTSALTELGKRVSPFCFIYVAMAGTFATFSFSLILLTPKLLPSFPLC